MTRNGKIARLPGNIREELNNRLEDGQEGPALLDWLNALPEVQASLRERFNGSLISKQNLSEWRQGGFREWQIRRDLLEQARQLAENHGEMENAVDTTALPGALAAALAARYAAVLNSWDGEPDEKIEAQLRLLRGLNRDIALLQTTVQRAEEQKREVEEAAEEEMRRETEEIRARSLNMLKSIPEIEALEAVLGGGERAKKIARMMTAVKYDLPLSKEEASAMRGSQAQSEPVKPVSAKSNRTKARRSETRKGETDPTKESPIQTSPTE